MTISPYITLVALVVQQGALVASLSWVAWHYERRNGSDAFYLALPALIGIFATWSLASITGTSLLAAFAAGVFASAACDAAITFAVHRTAQHHPQVVLLGAIVLTGIALPLFDFATKHQPLAVSYAQFGTLTTVSILLLASLLTFGAVGKDVYLTELELGVQGRQIAQGWREIRCYPSVLFMVSYLASWFIALMLPLTTSGVTSYRVLRDTVIALLVVRLVGSRKPTLIPLIALAIGSVRVMVGFTAVGSWAAPATEVTIVTAALLISRWNSSSRKWSDIRV